MTELELLEKASSKRVLFLGEKIIDVYNYVKPLGRPTKDAIVSVELVGSESFDGGVVAAAAHARPLCRSLDVRVGGDCYQKQRWIEASHLHKLFECYTATTSAPTRTATGISEYDAVIVTDYGHGMATPAFISSLVAAKFLAINVQTNSGNYGFNLATKYKHANYLCVDEPEARLATQNRSGPIEDSLEALGSIAEKVVVTLGKGGAIGLQEGVVSRSRAFTGSVVDTIGSGDAFFAVTAIVAAESDMPTLLRIGNAAGAIKAQIVGHREAITKDELIKYLKRIPA